MAEIKDEVFINFARELTAKLTEVVKNIDIESIDLYKLGYEKGRADEREKIEVLLDVIVTFENDSICNEIYKTEHCTKCNYCFPQKECHLKYLEYIKEQKKELRNEHSS